MINDNNFYQVSGWMITRMNLKGIRLAVYAIIYGFSQGGQGRFNGSKAYLMEWCCCGETSVKNALKSLVKDGLINLHEVPHKYGTVNEYSVNTKAIKRGSKSDRGQNLTGVKICPKGGQNLPEGGSKFDPIYNSINNSENKTQQSAREKITESEIEEFDQQAPPVPDFLKDKVSATADERKKVPAKKEINLIEVCGIVTNYLTNTEQGLEFLKFATKNYKGTEEAKIEEIEILISWMYDKGEHRRLCNFIENPGSISGRLNTWFKNAGCADRATKSIQNAASRKTQNNRNLISEQDAQWVYEQLQKPDSQRG